MPSYPVHWFEGMFLQPHHLQLADRHARSELRQAEAWLRPFHWGLRHADVDRDAVANYLFSLRACEARFRDGTRISIPEDGTVDPADLRPALVAAKGEPLTVYLGVPTLQSGRPNVEPAPTANGPRYWVDQVEVVDDNPGGQEQAVEIRRTRARLLLSGQDHTGYETVPLARIERGAQADAPPQINKDYVPPLLSVDAWPHLWESIQSLFHQIGGRIDTLADQVTTLDSQESGHAERVLKLTTINGAYSALESVAFLQGLPPLWLYRELCGIVGQLAIFTEDRRPPRLPQYDHEDLGNCFFTVLKLIQLGLDTITPSAFEKEYFEKMGERLQVALKPTWLDKTKTLFLGVETELTDEECEQLLRAVDRKMGAGTRVEQIYRQALRGLKLVPIVRPPRQLPPGPGIVYYQIERDAVFWRDVADTLTMAIRMNFNQTTFQGNRILTVVRPGSDKTTNLQFALYVI